MGIIARITSDAKIHANSFNTQQLAWDDSGVIEETHLLEDTTLFDESAELDTLITFLFDNNTSTLEDLVLTNIFMDEHGNIFAHEFCNTEPYFDDTETIDDTSTLDDTTNLNDENGAETLLNYLFSTVTTDTAITKVSVHNNKQILANGFVVGL